VLFASVIAPVTPATVGWVLLAFTSARFAAMAFNRLVDRDVDAINPRTVMRELPAGTLTVGQAKFSIAVSSVLFVIASGMLNPLCLALSPVALLWVLGYSYTKRFTRWSHLWLGLGLAIAPVGGYLAVTGAWSQPWWLLCVLAFAVVCWSGGFDMIYALQDAEFDAQQVWCGTRYRHRAHTARAGGGRVQCRGGLSPARFCHATRERNSVGCGGGHRAHAALGAPPREG
jgi:4-hydroxybenzoate polyprenyltransferase